ncbi:MAG: hypothetical protein AB1439_05180 [candidate division FCPU426 bacterium]
MQLRPRPALFMAGVIIQAVGLATWWEWFNALAFGTGSLAWGIFKAVCLSGLLATWSFVLAWRLELKYGWEAEDYRFQDMLAGLPLALLPLIIPLAPWLAAAFKPFSLTLLGFTWLPWWGHGVVLSAAAKSVLLASGVLIVGAALAKMGLLVARLLAADPERVTAGRLFAAGVLIYLAVLSWPACMLAPQGGERSQLLLMQSIAMDSSLNVDGVLGRRDYRDWYPLTHIEFNGHTDGIGRLYLATAPGMPILFLLLYLIQGRWLMSVLSMLFAAGAAAQLFGFCRDLGFSERSSIRTWALALLTLPLALYGYLEYEVAAGAFFMLWGLRLAWKEEPSAASASAVGLVSGLLLLGGIRFVAPAAVLMAVLAWRLACRQRTIHYPAALVVAAVPGVFAGWFFSSIYGFLLGHPVYHLMWPWQAGAAQNLLGLLTDRFSGILWTAPVWVLGLSGLLRLWSGTGRILVAAVALLFINAVLTAMSFPDPWGDGAAYHRFVAPVVPLLGLGLAWWWESDAVPQTWRRVLYALGGWSIGMAVLFALLPPLTWESSRLRLGEIFAPWGAFYSLLPSFVPRLLRWELLLSGAIILAAIWLAWSAHRALGPGRRSLKI